MMRAFTAAALLCLCLGLAWGCASRDQAPARPRPEKAGVGEQGCGYFYFLWGVTAEREGLVEEAREAYEKALICDPRAGYVMQNLTLLLIQTGETDEALNRLSAFVAGVDAASPLRVFLVKILRGLGRNQEALDECLAILDARPGEVRIVIMAAMLYSVLDQPDRAEQLVLTKLEHPEEVRDAQLFLARLYREQGQAARALEAYERALDLDWSADLLFEMASLHLEHKDWEAAARTYQRIIEVRPADEEALFALSRVYLSMDRFHRAREVLLRLRAVSEEPALVDLTLARLAYAQDRQDEAVGILEELLRHEDLAPARYMLAVLYRKQDRPADALAQLEKIGPEAEEYADALLVRVYLLRGMERLQEAAELLSLALREEEAPELYGMLALLLEEMERTDEVGETLARGVRRFPDSAPLLYDLGLWLERQGRTGEAMETMERVIALDPDFAEALNFVGYTWADHNERLQEALDYIRRAIALKPDSGAIRDSLGWVFFRLGRLEEARRELEEAGRIIEDDPFIHDHLGQVYQALGLLDKARRHFERARRLFVEEGEAELAAEIEERLDGLEPGGPQKGDRSAVPAD